MLTLAIDTATSAITVAVGNTSGTPVEDPTGASGGDAVTVLGAATRVDARGHTEWLAPLVAEALAQAGAAPTDLQRVVVGTGPGPFTGLRVGLVTAVTMGHALGIPVAGVSSLDALAAASPVAGEVLVATDARRKEVYAARYAVDAPREGARPARVRRIDPPSVHRPADLPEPLRALPTLGRGPLLYPELFPAGLDVLDVDAAVLLAHAVPRVEAGEDLPVEPLYLRRPDALTSAERAAR